MLIVWWLLNRALPPELVLPTTVAAVGLLVVVPSAPRLTAHYGAVVVVAAAVGPGVPACWVGDVQRTGAPPDPPAQVPAGDVLRVKLPAGTCAGDVEDRAEVLAADLRVCEVQVAAEPPCSPWTPGNA